MKKMGKILGLLLICGQATAVDLANLTTGEMAGGLKETLTKGAAQAVGRLGRENGFLNNEKVRIPLPDSLAKAEKVMRTFGMGKKADELVVTMNRAAEMAVPEAKTLLIDAVKKMTIQDARAIISGGDDAATAYFRRSTEAELTVKFLPLVRSCTEKVGLAQRYNDVAGKAVKYRLVEEKQANIEQYVTQKALDGLFATIAEEERAIRKDPIGTGSKLISKIFGYVR